MNQVISLAGRERKVAREVCEQEFERFADAMDLDVDPTRMDAADLKTFDDARHVLLRAMERGQLVIDEKGQPVFTASDGTAITFYEPTGATFMSMDTKKKEQEVAKMYAIMAEITRLPDKTFSKMPMRDLKVCRTIVTLFLG
jgi:hypothetical protein